MKHLTPELEAKIRNMLSTAENQLQDYLVLRRNLRDEKGEMPKPQLNELEAVAWRRALRWVLKEAGCEGVEQ